jgi:low temperature requirement protein LtrA
MSRQPRDARRMTDIEPLVGEPNVEEEERKTSYLELFFDLVFVFAFTQVTALILEDTSPRGFARAALVLAMVWWAWSAYAWMTNAIDVENAVTRLIIFAAMVAGFFMALAVPDAFQDEAAWFAVAYFVVRVLNSALYSWGVRDDPGTLRATFRLAPWFLGAAVVALVGGFVDADYRAWVWLASLVIDVVGTLTVARAEWHVSPSHFAERFALIVIIALGESIVAIGVGTAGLTRDATYAVSVVVAFAGVAALWWAYFDFTAIAAERALRRASPRARALLARDVFTYFHYPVVLGIILYAVAAKKTLEHPLDPLPAAGRWALGLGFAFFLCGFALMRFRVVRRVAWERLAAAAAALIVAVLLDGADAIVTLAVVIVILVFSVALETARLRELRAELRAAR